MGRNTVITEKDLPSFVAVVAVISGVNLLIPLLPSPDGVMSTEVATTRAIAAMGGVLLAIFVARRFRSSLTPPVWGGLVSIAALGAATLGTAGWNSISRGAVLAALPVFLAPFLTAFLLGQRGGGA